MLLHVTYIPFHGTLYEEDSIGKYGDVVYVWCMRVSVGAQLYVSCAWDAVRKHR